MQHALRPLPAPCNGRRLSASSICPPTRTAAKATLVFKYGPAQCAPASTKGTDDAAFGVDVDVDLAPAMVAACTNGIKTSASALARRGEQTFSQFNDAAAMRTVRASSGNVAGAGVLGATPQVGSGRTQAPPNLSLKRSANGRPPGPRSALVYPALRGPGVLPLAPA